MTDNNVQTAEEKPENEKCRTAEGKSENEKCRTAEGEPADEKYRNTEGQPEAGKYRTAEGRPEDGKCRTAEGRPEDGKYFTAESLKENEIKYSGRESDNREKYINKICLFWLASLPEISRSGMRRILERFGTPLAVYLSDSQDAGWTEIAQHVSGEFLSELMKRPLLSELERRLKAVKKRGINFIVPEDSCFPKKLLRIPDPPLWLFVRGALPDGNLPSVSVIGARNCSLYGEQAALYFSERLAEQGVQIISGLARGIDGKAHTGALNVNGKTFGVLGNGPDVIFPASNSGLYRAVEQNGGLISEYPPGTKGLPYHFPDRNRIISGLSDAVFVVEAGEKSGTLITVCCGLEQGKTILALPGRITDRLSVGCNRLIREGAVPVTCTEDILFELDSMIRIEPKKESHFLKMDKALAREEKIVYSVLSFDPKHVENIASESNLDIADTVAALTKLELMGLVSQAEKGCYIPGKLIPGAESVSVERYPESTGRRTGSGKKSGNCRVACKSKNNKEISGNGL